MRNESKDPQRAAYNRLKGHAKARGKEFSISLEYFRQFCHQVDYIANKGRSSTAYHIDRKDETKGYVEGNLQVLTNAENVRKYKRWKGLNEFNQSQFEVVTVKPQQTSEDDCPF